MDREHLILDHLPLVTHVARAIYLNTPCELDDLISVGTVGLIRAADRYEASFESSFANYAYWLIRGHIYDYLRSEDWLSRDMRKQVKNGKLHATLVSLDGFDPDSEFLGRFEDLESKLDAMREIDHLKAAMDRLPNRSFLILYMYYWRDMSMEEIRQEFNLSLTRISQIIATSKKKLRQELADVGVHSVEHSRSV